jgi:hypothetical protein
VGGTAARHFGAKVLLCLTSCGHTFTQYGMVGDGSNAPNSDAESLE